MNRSLWQMGTLGSLLLVLGASCGDPGGDFPMGGMTFEEESGAKPPRADGPRRDWQPDHAPAGFENPSRDSAPHRDSPSRWDGWGQSRPMPSDSMPSDSMPSGSGSWGSSRPMPSDSMPSNSGSWGSSRPMPSDSMPSGSGSWGSSRPMPSDSMPSRSFSDR